MAKAYTKRGVVYDPVFLGAVNAIDPLDPLRIEKMRDEEVILLNRTTHKELEQDGFEALLKFDTSKKELENVVYFREGKPVAYYATDMFAGFIA